LDKLVDGFVVDLGFVQEVAFEDGVYNLVKDILVVVTAQGFFSLRGV
jgi:hypothetical protein